MKTKKLAIKIKSTAQYLKLFNGVTELTDTEIRILAAFIDEYKIIEEAGLEMNMFSTPMKKKVAKKLGRGDFNTLNNFIKSMHDKRVLVKTVEGYKVASTLMPKGESTIEFSLKYE